MTDDDALARRLAVTLAQAGHALPKAPADTVGTVRRRFVRRRRRMRLATSLAAAVVAVLTAAVAAGPQLGLRPQPAGPDSDVIRMWVLATAENNTGLRNRVDAFNDDADVRLEMRTFGNDAYQRVMAGPGLPEPFPDIFENWGGAALTDAVDAGRVADLNDPPAAVDLFLPNVLAGGQVGGRQYGLPMTGVQPIVLYYHKGLFADAGLNPPRTYADLLAAVDTFRERGVTPLALAGAERWPSLMYLMYLTERLGGPGVFDGIAAGNAGAWERPEVREAAAMTQDLVRRGAFGDGAGARGYDTGDTTRMLGAGQAAMQLMGSWEYGIQAAANPAFAAGGLGWVPFPTVPGGTGDPANVVGVPANYLSVDEDSPHRDEAIDFLVDTVTSDEFIDGLLAAGEVPAVRDLEPRLAGQPHAEFARFVHRLAVDAPCFTLAWDQALPHATAQVLLDNTRKLFDLEITPDQFVAAMAATG